MPELDETFKQLRLWAMKEKMAERNREAIENKLTYPEFLGLLLQDEVMRRDTSKFASRVRKANFKIGKTIENFDFDFNPKINKPLIMELAACDFIKENTPVLIIGPCGTGKSHLAQAIGFCAVKKGIYVLCFSQTNLIKELQSARAINNYDKKLRIIAKVPLLIIDDFGLKPLRTPDDEMLHDLIDERYESASTIITSNLALSEWVEPFQNRLLGTATVDRLRHGAYTATLDGDSYRASKYDNEKFLGSS